MLKIEVDKLWLSALLELLGNECKKNEATNAGCSSCPAFYEGHCLFMGNYQKPSEWEFIKEYSDHVGEDNFQSLFKKPLINLDTIKPKSGQQKFDGF